MEKNIVNVAYKKTVEECIQKYGSHIENGLSSQEALNRLKREGPNEIKEYSESLFFLFLKQFQSPLIYLLFFAAALIYFVGERFDAFITAGILLFNAIIATLQEGKAHAVLAGLRHYITHESLVIRDGKQHIIPTKNLVIGDIIIVQEGDRVPADARIVHVHNLLVDESMLTGESEAIVKQSAALENEVPIAAQSNMLFSGTYIYSGIAHALVIAIGDSTQMGQLKQLVEGIESDLPLNKKIKELTKKIVFFIVVQIFLFLCIGLFWEKSLEELAVFLAALFICVIPEGLPLVLTLALVAGVHRMAKHNLLVKRLQAVEGLAFTTIIMIDKTGTLTRNELCVNNFFAHKNYFKVTGEGYFPQGTISNSDLSLESQGVIKKIGKACHVLGMYAQLEYDKKTGIFKIKGDPTDASLLVLSKKIEKQFDHNLRTWKEIIPTTFDRKYHIKSGLYSYDDTTIALIVGSPETVFSRCSFVHNEVKEALKKFLSQGFRVIALAYKENVAPDNFDESIKGELIFLAVFALHDTIRPEAATMVEQARKAGLRIVMATGDNKNTALFVAKNVGIFKDKDESFDGNEIMGMTNDEIAAQLPFITVYSRVSPEQKLRLIRIYQQEGNNIAMTGDGVNDAPALVAANIGIAMGQMGTEVAKQSSDMILLDDSFSTILQAIKEGRNIFFTLRRVVLYFFVTNCAELLIVFFALCVNWPLPLFPAQILLMNFITDGLLNVSLVAEDLDQGVLNYKISVHRQGLIDRSMALKILFMALPMAAVSLAIFYYYKSYVKEARTMLFVTLTLFQVFNAWNCRSEKKSLFYSNFFSNRWLIIANCIVLILLISAIYLPFFQEIFRTSSISGKQWLLIIVITAPILVWEEMRKYISSKILTI